MSVLRMGSALVLSGALVACGDSRPPFAGSYSPPNTDGGIHDSGLFTLITPPAPSGDAAGYCGDQILPLVENHPNIYFVLDASGSMSDGIDGPGTQAKYSAALSAISGLVQTIGPRASFGAAVFPGNPGTITDICPVGVQVFPATPGDPVNLTPRAPIGPMLRGLLTALGRHSPDGLTPTAASLEALKPNLLALKGTTYALLLTDGAPNCDAAFACDAADCTVNIEGPPDPCGAPAGVSCCQPAYGYDYTDCLDANATVNAIADLAANGIKTYVVGMPGTSFYTALLDRMAFVGGTARTGATEYYPVTGSSDLASTLEGIGVSVAISCDIPLKEKPPDPNLVNVYFDLTYVPSDPDNGWTWVSEDASVDASTGTDVVRLVGNACTALKSGAVGQVQVVAGCPTKTR